jgi:replication factor A1
MYILNQSTFLFLLAQANDGAHQVPQMRFDFTPLANLASLNEKDIVDVIAIVTEVGEFTDNNNPKTNRPMLKRNLTLIDPSGFTTQVTLWGHQAQTFELPAQNAVIAMKGVSVSNYGGKIQASQYIQCVECVDVSLGSNE